MGGEREGGRRGSPQPLCAFWWEGKKGSFRNRRGLFIYFYFIYLHLFVCLLYVLNRRLPLTVGHSQAPPTHFPPPRFPLSSAWPAREPLSAARLAAAPVHQVGWSHPLPDHPSCPLGKFASGPRGGGRGGEGRKGEGSPASPGSRLALSAAAAAPIGPRRGYRDTFPGDTRKRWGRSLWGFSSRLLPPRR